MSVGRHLPGALCPRCGREQLYATGIGTACMVRCAATFTLTRPSGFAVGERLALSEQIQRSSAEPGLDQGQEQLREPCGWEQSGKAFLESAG